MDRAAIVTVGSQINTEEYLHNAFGHALKRASRDLIFKERVRQNAILRRRWASFFKFRPSF